MRNFIMTFVLVVVCNTNLLAQEKINPLAQRMEQVIPMLRDANEPAALIGVHNAAAEGHLQGGNLERARVHIDEALRLCREKNQPQLLTTVLMTATKLLNKSEPDAANKFLARLLKDAGHDVKAQRAILDTMGKNLLASGDLVAAIQIFYEHLESVKKLEPGTEAEVWALQQYGQTCLLGKMFDLGLPALKKGMALAEKLNRQDLASLFPGFIGSACLETGEYELARSAFTKQLELSSTPQSDTFRFNAFTNLAMVHFRLQDLDAAKSVIEIAMEQAKDAMTLGFARSQLAIVTVLNARNQDGSYDREQVQTAIGQLEKAIEEKLSLYPIGMRASFGAEVTASDYVTLTSLHLIAGQLEEAERTLLAAENGARKSAQRIAAAVKSGVFSADQANLAAADRDASISELKQQILVRQSKFEEALVVAEAGRGLAQARLMESRLGIDRKLTQPEKPLTLEEIKASTRQQDTTLVVYSVVHSLDNITRGMIGPSHPAGVPQSIYIWIISSTGEIHFVTVPLAESLHDLVQKAREEIDRGFHTANAAIIDESDDGPPAMSSVDEKKNSTKSVEPTIVVDEGPNDRGANNKSGNEPGSPDERALPKLYQLLVDPISRYLPANADNCVTLVPQGSLFAVPFAALPNAAGEHWVLKRTLATVPSIEVLLLAGKQQLAAENANLKKVLVVGNPTMPAFRSRPDKDPTPLSPLPGAEQEAKFIGQLLKTDPLIGNAATEEKVVVEMKSARVIHLATHGLLEANNVYNGAMLSSIALASSDKEDGFLSVRETMRLELRAELAVLSACDSGRGQITGDGVVGLTRGYFAAGVPTVIVSLWPVSDEATAFLMARFYEAKMKGASKGAALRTAMLKTRDVYPAPNLWAPFALYGVSR